MDAGYECSGMQCLYACSILARANCSANTFARREAAIVFSRKIVPVELR